MQHRCLTYCHPTPTPTPTLTRYIIYAVGMCSVFVLLEGIEIVGSGPIEYFMNMWNIMDWLNFAIFFLTWATMLLLDDYVANRECGHICSTVGCSPRLGLLLSLLSRCLRYSPSLTVTR